MNRESEFSLTDGVRVLEADDELALDVPYTPAELARYVREKKKVPITTKAMRKKLMKLHKLCGDLLVREYGNGDPRGDRLVVVSVASLRRFWRDFGKKFASHDDLELSVKNAMTAIRKDVRALQKRAREVEKFQQMSLAWFERSLKRPGEA